MNTTYIKDGSRIYLSRKKINFLNLVVRKFVILQEFYRRIMNSYSVKLFEGVDQVGHMTIAKKKVFEKLVQRLDQNPVGVVINETLFSILHIMYTEAEAEIGSKFPLRPSSFESIAEQMEMPEKELITLLDDMANKGLVIDIPRGNTVFYMLTPLVIGFFEYTFMRVTDKLPQKELAQLFDEYHHANGVPEKFFGADTKLFQTLAYEDLMPDDVETEVLSYERASDIISQSGGGALSMCYCRHQAKHLGTNCDAPIEDVCTSLGGAADWLIRRGFARPAGVDELLGVLEKTEKLGLVHLGDNVQNKPAYICHCCGCCCGVLRSINEHDIEAVHPSNFIPKVDSDKCIGCGICAERCHINAVSIRDEASEEVAVVDNERCIGCGVCIAGCENDAIHLERRLDIYVPPNNKKEQMARIIKERKS